VDIPPTTRVSAIKLFVGFGVDDHLIRELMRFIEMHAGNLKRG
jgi:hypothetical protein